MTRKILAGLILLPFVVLFSPFLFGAGVAASVFWALDQFLGDDRCG